MRALAVAGDLVADVVARSPRRLEEGEDLPGTVRLAPGGSAGNVAAWAAFLGAPVRFVGRTGDDPLGAWVVADLVERGVEVAATRDPAHATGLISIHTAPGADRTMISDRGASAHLAPEDVPDDWLVGAGALHLTGYLFQTPSGVATARRLLDLARRAGVAVSLDPAPPALDGAVRPAIARAAAEAMLLLPSLSEALALRGPAPPDEAIARLVRVAPRVVVTLGERGSLVVERPWPAAAAVPAAPADVVDPTGAGDAFAAGLLVALLRGVDLVEAAAHAARTAAACVEILGGRPPGRRASG